MIKSIFLPALLLSVLLTHKTYASHDEEKSSKTSWTTLEVQKAIEEADESIQQLYVELEAKREIDPIKDPDTVAALFGFTKPRTSTISPIPNSHVHATQRINNWTTQELNKALEEADPLKIDLYMELQDQGAIDPIGNPTAVAELLEFTKPGNAPRPSLQNFNPLSAPPIQKTMPLPAREDVRKQADIGLSEAENAKALVKAVKEIGGLSANGTLDPAIYNPAVAFAQEMATNYLSNTLYQASTSPLLEFSVISHAGGQQRFAAFSGRIKEEILATATARTLEDATRIIVRDWFDSPDHKESMMLYHDRYGYALVRTDQLPGMAGYQWFAVGLFADN